MKTLLLTVLLAALALQAQEKDNLEGLWQGYDGEWVHVSKQLIALAEALPAEKLSWRPAPGVRSTSEPRKSSYPVASARRPVSPMTLPPRNFRKAALRISFHRSVCVNCSAVVLIRLRNPLTLVRISAICAAFACVLVISTVV